MVLVFLLLFFFGIMGNMTVTYIWVLLQFSAASLLTDACIWQRDIYLHKFLKVSMCMCNQFICPCSCSVLVVFQLPLNFQNAPSVVQLLGLAPSAAAYESQILQPDVMTAVASSSSSDAVKQELVIQVPVTCGSATVNESTVLDTTLSLPSSSLDVTSTAGSIFPVAADSPVRPVIQPDAGGSGDADSSSLVKGNDAGTLYQTAGLLHGVHTGGGDDLGMSQVALFSSQTEAQLQELFRQQQWHLRLNQMMQLDVLQQQQSQAAAPVVIGADTAAAASLLWHQQQQQHAANPATVSFAFCNDQVSQQQQQLLLQQQQPQTTVEMKYEVQQQTKPAAEQTQSPRQQKPRLIARGNEAAVFYIIKHLLCK